jgi:hypothetical protein
MIKAVPVNVTTIATNTTFRMQLALGSAKMSSTWFRV